MMGQQVSITSQRPRTEEAAAETIRHKTTHGKGFIHELRPHGVTNQLHWAMGEGEEVYRITWGKGAWVTHIREI